MEEFLSRLNYKISSSKKDENKVEFIVINNPDGTPRWFCNASSKSPLFLKFYLISSRKSKLFALFFKTIFKFKLQKLALKTITLYIEPISKDLKNLNLFDKNWAVFTGTIGPNNKMLVYKEENAKASFFKIGTTETSKQIITNEYATLEKLKGKFSANFKIPEVIDFNDNLIEIEDLSYVSNRENTLAKKHVDFLKELYSISNQNLSFNEIDEKFLIKEKLNNLNQSIDKRLPFGMLRKLFFLFEEFKEETFQTSIGHGDFTSWNMYANNDLLAVYDWELSKENLPNGFDAFHFIFQENTLVSRRSWKDFKSDILDSNEISNLFNAESLNIVKYLKLYLLINVVEYLTIYSEQQKWHVQINWLLTTWNDALSYCLEGKMTSKRGLFIIDFFDFIKNKQYATIKFIQEAPENLSEYSDIDICIRRNDLTDLLYFIASSQFVKSVSNKKITHMNSVFIFFDDGSTLSIDFIWQFKRKEIDFLNANQVLSNAESNSFGVKHMDNHSLSLYVGLFYGLNGSKVPNHYLYLKEYLKPQEKLLDKLLAITYDQEKVDKSSVLKIIKSNSVNKGFQKIKNNILYFKDVLVELKISKGMIITFSGVDGAGKSTIIDNVKRELEKKYRKKVVVIRHRPSLLPILSAWTKGKEKAEQDAANTLPRQGNNSSKLSSFVRFSYYYIDYLFGQFYVNFKYKYRGVIVLYDRYYYDFILDAKRSNIDLPEGLVKFGFNFVFTPDCNFFLYASPEVILKRKQELSAETILELTKKYGDLFTEFESKKNSQNYFLINNIDLEETMKKIMGTITNKM